MVFKNLCFFLLRRWCPGERGKGQAGNWSLGWGGMYKVKGGASCSARKLILGSGAPTGSGAAQAPVSEKNTKNQHPKDTGAPRSQTHATHGVLGRSSLAPGAVSWCCKLLFFLVTPLGSPSLHPERDIHHFLQIQLPASQVVQQDHF